MVVAAMTMVYPLVLVADTTCSDRSERITRSWWGSCEASPADEAAGRETKAGR
jgi:hypothetical protein